VYGSGSENDVEQGRTELFGRRTFQAARPALTWPVGGFITPGGLPFIASRSTVVSARLVGRLALVRWASLRDETGVLIVAEMLRDEEVDA